MLRQLYPPASFRPDGIVGLWAGADVEWIAPHRSFHLIEWSEDDSNGFSAPAWAARGPDCDVLLLVSRFHFTPTQARFEWLIDNVVLGGRRSGSGPWTDKRIDAEIASEGAVEVVRVAYGRGSPEFRRAALALVGGTEA